MRCPRCGRLLSAKVKWCPFCGHTFPRPAWLLPAKIAAALVAGTLAVLFFVKGVPYLRFEKDYMAAIELMEQQHYGEAEAVFLEMPKYKYASDFAQECRYSYAGVFDMAAADIYVSGYMAQLVCGQISGAWSDAIRNSPQNFNAEIRSFLSTWKATETYEMTEQLNSHIQEAMSVLRSPTSEYEEAYPLLLDLYDIYSELYSQSTSPSGSLSTYNSRVDELSGTLEQTFNQLKMIKPEIEGDPSGIVDSVLEAI